VLQQKEFFLLCSLAVA